MFLTPVGEWLAYRFTEAQMQAKCKGGDESIGMSTCSVAASYKPPMLVTRVRLPACAVLAAELLTLPSVGAAGCAISKPSVSRSSVRLCIVW